MRTGQYKFLNAGVIYEGVNVNHNILTGEVEFSGEATSEKAQGYFAYMQLLNGYTKTVYMTHEEILKHAKRYSKSYNNESSAWKSNFDEMAMKTCTRKLLGHYGILSTDMVVALTSDHEADIERQLDNEITVNANSELIDIQAETANEPVQEQPAGPVF
jgi:recombination protein RecT